MTEEAPSAAPHAIGRYRIESKIGSGASGTVYRAFDPLLQRTVAIKIPNFRSLDEKAVEALVADFYHEAAIAGRFHHPNVVTTYDVSRDREFDFIVMEFVPGHSAREQIRASGPLDVAEALDVGYQCCLGLDYVHYQGILHRDLKPANIMRNANGGPVKLMDFSIAHRIEDHAQRDRGTVAYMAPENFDPSHPLGPSADVFALGSTLHELLIGEPPFTGEQTSIIFRILHEPATALHELRPKIPGVVSTLIARAGAKDPAARYASALEFAEAIDSARGELGIGARGSAASGQAPGSPSAPYVRLRNSEWFRDFPPEQVHEMLELGAMEQHDDGTAIVREGEPGSDFYILLSGDAVVSKADRVVNEMHAGDCFGEMALLSSEPRTASVVARGVAIVWKVSGRVLELASGNSQAGFYKTFLRVVMGRLDDRTRDVATLRATLDRTRG